MAQKTQNQRTIELFEMQVEEKIHFKFTTNEVLRKYDYEHRFE